MPRPLIGRAKRATAYAAAVVAALAKEFPDLREPATADLVTTAITEHVLTPGPQLEIILDSGYVANWWLHADPADPARVRLGCHRHPPIEADQQREARLNALLDAL
ncbi:hypothetical protein [Streptosporangium sp. CA-115845]|uniref:hypothetical protein n=1 Tax=Streptosporangium sp. CA-115845 TaxID=3240071 RepID=UPI003D8C321F